MQLLFFGGTGLFPQNLFVCILFTITGGIMVWRMSRLLSRELKLLQHFRRTSGTIIEIHYDEEGNGYPLLEYDTEQYGLLQNMMNKVVTHLHQSDPDSDWQIGRRLVVHYNEHNPNDFFVGETRGKPAKLLVLVIGAFFLVAGLGGLLTKI